MSKKKQFVEVEEGIVEKAFGLPGKSTQELVVQDRQTGKQFYFNVDMIHADANEAGDGELAITWDVSLKWSEGIDGTHAWRKVVSLTNHSDSTQSVGIKISRLT